MSSADPRSIVHGGPDHAELAALGIDYAGLLDFSVSTNPYGPCDAMREAIARAVVDHYPDPTATPARRALGAWLDVAPGSIAIGNGAADLLWTIARALLGANDRVLIVEPTFGEFRAACGAVGAAIHEWRAALDRRTGQTGFAIDLEAISAAARACSARAIYLCSPNNPTGSSLAATDIARWAASQPTATVVLDQSFLSLSERFAERAQRMPDNVVVVRSLTKDHTLPGLRVGYAIAAGELAARIERQRPAWSASAAAQAAATAATTLDAFVAQSRETLLHDRAALVAELARIGLHACAADANFVLVRAAGATHLRGQLLHSERILIRDCASFGLPNFIRLAARSAPDRTRLIAALQRCRA